MDTFKFEHFNSNVYLCYYINIWFCKFFMCLSIYFVILELEQGIFYFIIQWMFTVELRINSDYFLSYSISLNWLYSLGPLNWFRNAIICLKYGMKIPLLHHHGVLDLLTKLCWQSKLVGCKQKFCTRDKWKLFSKQLWTESKS